MKLNNNLFLSKSVFENSDRHGSRRGNEADLLSKMRRRPPLPGNPPRHLGNYHFGPSTCGCLLLVLAMGLFLAACKQEVGSSGKQAASAPAKSDHVGTFNLVSINDAKLPCTPPHQGGAPEVQSGVITLNAEGTLSTTTTFKVPSGKVVNREVSGTYTREGPQFTMKWTGAGRTTATLEGTTFTMNNEGMMFVYSK